MPPIIVHEWPVSTPDSELPAGGPELPLSPNPTLVPSPSFSDDSRFEEKLDEKKTPVQVIERWRSSDSASAAKDFDSSENLCPTDTFPEGGLQAWLTVAGSFCTVAAGFGLINSVGIVQSYLEMHQLRAFKDRDVAWIPAVNVFLCLFLGVQVGPMFDRYGPRWLMAGGSVAYTGGLICLSFLGCEEDGGHHVHLDPGVKDGPRYALLLLAWGVLCGAGAALICTTAMAVVSHWFDRRRGLANGVVFVGSSLGGALFPLLLRATLDSMGWSATMRFCALAVAVLLCLGNLMMRGRLRGRKGTGTVNLRCFLDSRFVWTTAAIACKFWRPRLFAFSWYLRRGLDADLDWMKYSSLYSLVLWVCFPAGP